MLYINKIILGILFVLIYEVSYSQNVDQDYEVGIWQGFRQGAVSFTFDDGNSNQFDVALPMFDEFGFKMTFFTVVNWGPNWSKLQTAADSGHEVASHTMSHADISQLKIEQQEPELKNSQAQINSKIRGQKCVSIAYPYCNAGDKVLCEKYYIAARGCSGSIIPKTPSNFMNISSFVCGSLGSVKTSQDFNNKANSAASSKGWVVFLIHGIDNDGGYSPVTSDNLRGAVEFLNSNSEKFWVNTFGNVAKYIKERNNVSVKESSNEDSVITFTVTDTLDNSIFNYPVTIRRVLPEGWSSGVIFQNDKKLISQIIDKDSVKYIMFDVVPDSGDVYLKEMNLTDVTDNSKKLPASPYLMQNFPNPFNPVTRIEYTVPVGTRSRQVGMFVQLKVYDVLGREVETLVDEYKLAGKYSIEFNGSNLTSGMYYYTLKSDNFSSTKKFVLLK